MSDDFITLYLDYTKNNEAPELYHKWVAISIIGASLGRRIFFDKGYYKVYPCHFIILIGPSGKVRKSVSAGIGVNLLRQVTDINIIAEKITPEQLLSALSVKKILNKVQYIDSSGFIFASELAAFLGKQKYNEGLIPMLTTLADCPDSWTYSTKMGGKVELENVALSFLGCSTPDWIVESLPPAVFGGGFMSRCLFVVQEFTTRVNALPKIEAPEIRERLILMLRDISNIEGQITLTKEGEKFYVDWYKKNKSINVEESKMEAYFERKPDHLLRLAMVLCAAKNNPNDLVIDSMMLEKALLFLNEIEQYLPSTFGEIEANPQARIQARILKAIDKEEKDEIEHSKLLRMFSKVVNVDQFRVIMSTLIEARVLQQDVKTKKLIYRLNKERI